jgi:hypothetical protein
VLFRSSTSYVIARSPSAEGRRSNLLKPLPLSPPPLGKRRGVEEFLKRGFALLDTFIVLG